MNAVPPCRLAAALLGLALLPLLFAPAPAMARDQGDFEVQPAAPIPEPNPLQAEVSQGDSVQITLSAWSLTSPIIRYRIREKPRLGTLAPSFYVNGKTGLVTYTPRPGAGAGEDEFTYSVQSEAGVSAPATVHIKILDTDPVLSVPLEIDFADVVSGTTASRQLTLQNIGGGTAEGTVQLPDGFTVEGSPDYQLLGGQKQTFTILFSPAAKRVYDGDIEYTGDPDRHTDIKGNGVMPVEVGVDDLELETQGKLRGGSIPLQNRTAQARSVRVQASPDLVVPDTVDIPANGQANIPLQTKPGDYGPVDESVAIGGDAEGAVHVTAPAVPPALDLRRTGNAGDAVQVIVENDGAPGQVVLSATGGFIVADADHFFRLDAGQMRTVALQIGHGLSGPVTGKVIADSGGDEAGLELTANASDLATEPLAPIAAAAPNIYSLPDSVTPPEAAETPAGYYARALRLDGIFGRKAVLKWNPGLEAAGWRLEDRTLSISGSNSLRVDWTPMDGVEFTRDKQTVTARTAPLDPGAVYVLRMTALDAKNNLLAVSGVVTFQIPAPRKSHTMLEIAAGALVLAGAAFWFWRRRRASS